MHRVYGCPSILGPLALAWGEMARQARGAMTLSFPPPRKGVGPRRSRGGLAPPWPRERAAEGASSLTLARAALIALMIIVTTLALLYLWQGWQLTELRAQLAARRAAVDEVVVENEALRLKVGQAFSLERIDLFAKTILGMVEPPLQYLHLPRKGP